MTGSEPINPCLCSESSIQHSGAGHCAHHDARPEGQCHGHESLRQENRGPCHS